MNKKLNKEISARTTDDSRTKADEMHVRPAIAKPTVGGWSFFRCQIFIPFISVTEFIDCSFKCKKRFRSSSFIKLSKSFSVANSTK